MGNMQHTHTQYIVSVTSNYTAENFNELHVTAKLNSTLNLLQFRLSTPIQSVMAVRIGRLDALRNWRVSIVRISRSFSIWKCISLGIILSGKNKIAQIISKAPTKLVVIPENGKLKKWRKFWAILLLLWCAAFQCSILFRLDIPFWSLLQCCGQWKVKMRKGVNDIKSNEW